MPISESYFTGITEADHIRDHLFVNQQILNRTKWFDTRRDIVIGVIVTLIAGFGGLFIDHTRSQITAQQDKDRVQQVLLMKQLIEEVKLMREAKQ